MREKMTGRGQGEREKEPWEIMVKETDGRLDAIQRRELGMDIDHAPLTGMDYVRIETVERFVDMLADAAGLDPSRPRSVTHTLDSVADKLKDADKNAVELEEKGNELEALKEKVEPLQEKLDELEEAARYISAPVDAIVLERTDIYGIQDALESAIALARRVPGQQQLVQGLEEKLRSLENIETQTIHLQVDPEADEEVESEYH